MSSMLSAFPVEKLILHKKDGSSQEVTALVDRGTIHSDDVNAVIEEGDIYERTLPNGAKEYYRVTDRGFYKGDHGIPDNYQSRVEKIPKTTAERELNGAKKEKQHKLFISHSSKDKEYMNALTEMLEDIGMPDGSFVCTSVPGHGIPGGADIFDWLRDQFITCDLRVLFALSHNYYDSAPSLNEMGAAWVTKATDTLLLLPGFKFSEIEGCINPREMGISFGAEDEELKHRLNEFKDTLIVEHHLQPITASRWERHRDRFIKAVREIADKKERQNIAQPEKDMSVGVYDQHPFDYPMVQLSANIMLFFAAEGDGEILALKTLGATMYRAGRYTLNTANEPRELAKWASAVEQLLHAGYIRRSSWKDPIYQVTEKGYAISDAFKETNGLDSAMTPDQVLALFEEDADHPKMKDDPVGFIDLDKYQIKD